MLSKLDGIDALREHLESLVREEITEHFVVPLESLLIELQAKDDSLSEADRLVLLHVKKRLARALPTEHVMDMASTLAQDLGKSAVKAQVALHDLQAWIRKREASLNAMPKPDHVR